MPLSREAEIGLWVNLRRCKAQQTIHLGNLSPTDYEGTFNTYLTAFGDMELAHKAKSKALERYVDSRIAAHGKRR